MLYYQIVSSLIRMTQVKAIELLGRVHTTKVFKLVGWQITGCCCCDVHKIRSHRMAVMQREMSGILNAVNS